VKPGNGLGRQGLVDLCILGDHYVLLRVHCSTGRPPASNLAVVEIVNEQVSAPPGGLGEVVVTPLAIEACRSEFKTGDISFLIDALCMRKTSSRLGPSSGKNHMIKFAARRCIEQVMRSSTRCRGSASTV
jgi:hypothetical protein